MLYSYNWIQEYIKGTLPKPDKLADLLSMHAFEVEEMSKKGRDTLLHIAVLPNRAHDCLSHVGMAREIAAIAKLKFAAPKTQAIKTRKGTLKPVKVRIQSTELVPRYTALLIEGVNIGKSSKWLVEKLQALGMNSINNVVDLTNFIMLEMGQPLHAFDYDQITGQLLYLRKSTEGEKLETLDRQTFSLPRDVLVIEDSKRLVDLAGIKGGKVSAISANTKNILLQAANFNASAIWRAKSQLQYTTQAADIYVHQIDPNLAIEALARANALLSEFGIGGTIVQYIDVYPKKIIPKKIPLDVRYVELILGVKIPEKEIRAILQRLGFRGTNSIQVPTRRLDVAIPEDLVEEIGRIYGYEKITATPPIAPLVSPARNNAVVWRQIAREALVAAGMTEVYTYSFSRRKGQVIKLENPINQEFSALRKSLLDNLFEVLRKNEKLAPKLKVFEIGKTFTPAVKPEEMEAEKVGGMILGGTFAEIKGIAEFLLERLGIDNDRITYADPSGGPWRIGGAANIIVDNKTLGKLGEWIIGDFWDIQVFAFEIDFEKLIKYATEERTYKAPSRFPASIRDIAVLVPKNMPVKNVIDIILPIPPTLIQNVEVFDIYEGVNIPEGKKNLAFHITYQSKERTLTSAEIDSVHEKIIKTLEEVPGWEVRN